MEAAGGIGWRSVYGVDWAGFVFPVEAVNAHLFPFPLPLLLDLENVAFFG